MGVLFKQKIDLFLGQGSNKKDARTKALKWFESTNTCRSCDSIIKSGEHYYSDKTYCIHCMG